MKQTPLYEWHLANGGRIVDFSGWELPIQYSGIIEEHKSVRERVGIFDVSHMGELILIGKEAKEAIQHLITNTIEDAEKGKVIYSPMCYHNGTVVDDLLVYCYSDEHYLIVVNASNIDKDYKWMTSNTKEFDVQWKNGSKEYAQIAIQGPLAEVVLQRVTQVALRDLTFYHFTDEAIVANREVIISRTGYTGEDGFEVYVHSDGALEVWETIIGAGKAEGIVPCGLGARDSLRFEVALPLYGHELSDQINPIEAGLKMFVKTDKEEFIGKEALVRAIEKGTDKVIRGLEMIEKGIPRAGYEILHNDEIIGYVTTGGKSPSIDRCIALALIDKRYSQIGTEVLIQVRKKRLRAKIVNKPFYKKRYKK